MPATAMTLNSRTAPSSPDATKSHRTLLEVEPPPPPADFSSSVSRRRCERGEKRREREGREGGVACLLGMPAHRCEESAYPDSSHAWCWHSHPQCGTLSCRAQGLGTSRREACCIPQELAGSCAVPRRNSRPGRKPETWAWPRQRAWTWSAARIGEDPRRRHLHGRRGLTDDGNRYLMARNSPAVKLVWLTVLAMPPPSTPEGTYIRSSKTCHAPPMTTPAAHPNLRSGTELQPPKRRRVAEASR